MKHLNMIKLIFGIILISIPILGGINFLYCFFGNPQSNDSWMLISRLWFIGLDGGGASNTPLFFGLCAIAGAIILASIKSDSK